MSGNTTNKDPGGGREVPLSLLPSPLSVAAGAAGSAAGCALCCPGAVPSCRRAGAGRKLSGACLLFILATRCCSSAVACRPKFNAQMTPPSRPVCPETARNEGLHNRAAARRAQLFLGFICFVWSAAAEGEPSPFSGKVLRGLSEGEALLQ